MAVLRCSSSIAVFPLRPTARSCGVAVGRPPGCLHVWQAGRPRRVWSALLIDSVDKVICQF
jgi:hypothetical protein